VSIPHLPDRTTWDCTHCAAPWPCGPARRELSRTMSPTSLGMYLADHLYDAVPHLPGVTPAALWARFLGWTRGTAHPGVEPGAGVAEDPRVTELTTARLVLRPLTVAYLDAFAPMYADPEVMRFVGDGSVLDREQTAANLAAKEHHWQQHGYGIFAVHLGDAAVGWVGLAVPDFLPEVLPAVEIGWRLARPHWGAGIATEAAREVLRFAFDECDLHRLVSIRHIDNRQSGRVMEKLGMHLDRRTVVPGTRQPVEVWAVTRQL
jgi:RimJ/RimL family protein N-acetyltransferase